MPRWYLAPFFLHALFPNLKCSSLGAGNPVTSGVMFSLNGEWRGCVREPTTLFFFPLEISDKDDIFNNK